MTSETIMMTVLTHPFQALLIGMFLIRLAREAVATTTHARGIDSGRRPAPVVDLSERSAA